MKVAEANAALRLLDEKRAGPLLLQLSHTQP